MNRVDAEKAFVRLQEMRDTVMMTMAAGDVNEDGSQRESFRCSPLELPNLSSTQCRLMDLSGSQQCRKNHDANN